MLKGIKHYSLLLMFICTKTLQSQSWESLGPDGGKFSAIEISKSNPNIIYAGTYYGGLYKSINRGINWQYIGFKGDRIINTIAIDPYSSEKIFISWRIHDPTYESGAVKSLDGGVNWEEIALPSRTISTSNNISNVVFIGNNDGLYKSINGGNNFYKINYSFGFNNISIIESDPIDSTIIYLGTDNAIYRSQDGGEDWSKLRDVFDFSIYPAYVTSVAISPINNDKILVGTMHRGVLISDDGGNNWVEKNFGVQVHTVFCDDQNEEVIYVGHLSGFLKSKDFGTSWEELNNYRVIGGDMQGNTFFLLAEDLGKIFMSGDRGQTWLESNSGIQNIYVSSILCNSEENSSFLSIVKLGFYNNLISYQNSEFHTIREDENIGFKLFNNNGNIYLIGGLDYFSISTDNGFTWERFKNGLPYLSPTDLTFFNDTLYLACTIAFEGLDAGIYKSTDEGQQWYLSSDGLPLVERQHLGLTQLSPISIYSIAIDKNYSNNLYAGGYEDLFRSANNGKYWSKINSFQGKLINQIIVDSDSSNIIYVIADKMIYKSKDFGEFFSELYSGLEEINIILYDYNSDKLYAGGKYSVSASDDKGTLWKNFGDGLENSTITCLSIDHQSNQLFVGTLESGIYKLDMKTEVECMDNDQIYNYKLEQCYPNPFNASTRIRFSLQRSNFVKILVYNQLGQLIRTLVNEQKPSGEYSVFWDGRNDKGEIVTDGIYFHYMNVGGSFSVARKVILLK